MRILLIVFLLSSSLASYGQKDYFPFLVELTPVSIPELPGLHSYAYGQHDGKWVFIGGRIDGLHARQPFASFPEESNNTNIYVVDPTTKSVWSKNIGELHFLLSEQLQATNMNFIQENEHLYFIGGYAFSPSKNNHITFPNITSIHLPSLIESIISGNSISDSFTQIEDQRFAVTGGQMGRIGNLFYLVGGHRFDGRYNPMGNPTFSQAYTNQIKKFKLAIVNQQLEITDYEEITDPIHLRRRDYNLVPQVYPNGELGYMISSGVFQAQADLPFLYPVEIRSNGYNPITEFNQYLSNYHGAKIGIYDENNNQMHSLFFGGISQYFYENGELIKDDRVPFTKSISRVTRYHDGTYHEFLLPKEMPNLQGASSEFIPNLNLPMYANKVIKINEINENKFIIGHIFGGIFSPSKNPFSSNATNTTYADETLFEVKLVRSEIADIPKVDGANPFKISTFPNPTEELVYVKYHLSKNAITHYFLSNTSGQLLESGEFNDQIIGENIKAIKLPSNVGKQALLLTVVFDNRFYSTEKIIIR